ncbi:MAG: FtsX-like permease family protein [Gemmatimonadetes bacterium]|nr:FtsX-like permease family protein [Gemmatimonadota bacterium]
MTVGGLIRANLFRNKKRTFLTVASVAVAFFLYGVLRSVTTTLDAAAAVGSEARLVTSNASGITFTLPEAHANRLRSVPGVTSVSWSNWFGGYYRDPQDFFAQFAIKAESYLAMYPEIQITAGDREAFLRERTAALVGVGLLEKYGWQVGQTITLKGTIFSGDWEFVIRAAYTPAEAAYGDENMFFHYEYLYERTNGQITPGWFVVALDRPESAADIAATIDAQFKNSTAPTKTETERAFQAGFVTMWGNIGFLVRAIGTAVFFAILLVAANTMMMAVRERIGEIAVLKTVGFTDGAVAGLVIVESLLIALVGGALGLALAWSTFQGRNPMQAFFPGNGVTTGTTLLGFGLALLLGMISGAVPALQSARLSVTSALRRVA